jgi:membrane-bound lytic murein transglycosylase D
MLQIMSMLFTRIPAILTIVLLTFSPAKSADVVVLQDSFPPVASAAPAVLRTSIPDIVPTSSPSLTTGSPSSGTSEWSGLHPMAAAYVKDYVDRNRAFLEGLRNRNPSILHTIEQILKAHGLPEELKYLAIIESKLSLKAVSPMGAAGPWQLMPVTARAMGLRVRPGLDERLDVRKSTEAAATMLTRLHKDFGDWLLVIAAFNAGSGRMSAALRNHGGKDFWSVEAGLPQETRKHVRKYIATHYCLEGGGGVTTGLKPMQVPLYLCKPEDTDSLDIIGKYHSQVVARMLDMDPGMFDHLNPGFDARVGSEGYRLILPRERMHAFLTARLRILDACVRYLLDPGTFEMDRAATEIRLPPVRLA